MVTGQDLAKTLRARSAERRARAERRADGLRARLPEAARLLAERYRAGRVILFGSLADGTYSEDSDVDLAVEGMPPAGYFQALGELMALFGGPVDLVRVEDAAPSLRVYIEREGRPL